MFEHQDILEELNKPLPLNQKLFCVHQVLAQRYPFIHRIAAALYDPDTDKVKTFIHSSGDDTPLQHYEANLSTAASLKAVKDKGQPRVVNNLQVFKDGAHHHTQRINAQGYAASYTMPMYIDGNFFGFLFFNSSQENSFDDDTLNYLDVIGHLVMQIINQELNNMSNLLATIKTAKDIAHHRDDETGAHLDRMAHYAQLIALQIADKHDFTDEYIEQLFLFAPLHDIGKISTPDNILLKQDKLSTEEFEIMKNHTYAGRDIVDSILKNFQLENMTSVDVLRNIAELHHEAVNGSGYPHGLKGDEISIEARIVAVADVFDALTSQRPYKPAWNNDQAFAMLRGLAGVKLDSECVEALCKNREEVEFIQQHFTNIAQG